MDVFVGQVVVENVIRNGVVGRHSIVLVIGFGVRKGYDENILRHGTVIRGVRQEALNIVEKGLLVFWF